jgi:hypothetical protein
MKTIALFCMSLLSLATVQATNVKGKTPPAELQNFSAIYTGGKVNISWKTVTEANTVCFTIEKSKDGKNFSKVIDVPCNATCSNYMDYTEVDYNPYKEKSYYRLKQITKDGAYTYFTPVAVNFVDQKKLSVYHLPANCNPDAKTGAHDSQEVVVVLRDVQGKEFVSKLWLMIEKNIVFVLDEKKVVPPGSYVVTSSSVDKIYNYKLVVR